MATDFKVRFVAYVPNGDKWGVIPDAFDFNFSTLTNGVPSLSFKYERTGRRANVLEQDVEVAVEYYNGSDWVEGVNSRFIKIETDTDEIDDSGVVSYTLPGYSWMLDKAIVTSTLTRNPSNQKRPFRNATPGMILKTLIDEAKARGNIPGLSYDFAFSTDSHGAQWQWKDLSIDFDRGTTLESVLKALSDQGMCDWYMLGRTLKLVNPRSSAVSAAHAKAIRTSTLVDLGAVVADWRNHTDNDITHGQTTPQESGQFESDIAAFVAGGNPLFSGFRMGTTFGVRSTGGGTAEPIGVMQHTDTSDQAGRHRSWGCLIARQDSLPAVVFGVPEMTGSTNNLGVEENAIWAYLAMAGSVISLPGVDDTGNGDWHDGFHSHARALISRGMPYIEFGTFPEASAPNADIILQLGRARSRPRIDNMNKLKSNMPAGWRCVIDHVSLDGNEWTEDKWVTGPVIQREDGTWPEGDITIAGYNYEAIGRAEQLRSLLNKRSAEAEHYGTTYVRIMMKDSWAGLTSVAQALAEAIRKTFAAEFGPRIPAVGRRAPSTPDAPVRPNVSVSVFNGRDVTEAPTKTSIAGYAARVWAFGDDWAEATSVNDQAPTPWGAWEIAVGQGGVSDTLTMQAMVQRSLDEGMYQKVERTREVALDNTDFAPYRDYNPGDYLLISNREGGTEVVRVQQVTLTVNTDGALTAALVLSDRFEIPEVQMYNAVVAASGGVAGGTQTGGSGSRPSPGPSEVGSLQAPSAPGTPNAVSRLAYDSDGGDYGIIKITWPAVTLSTTGNPITIVKYEVVSRAIGGPWILRAQVGGNVTETDTERYVAGETVELAVRAYADGTGMLGEYSPVVRVTVEADTTPPPITSQPIVTTRLGTAKVTWNGLFAGNAPKPKDFYQLEVLVASVMPVTDASTVAGYIDNPDTPLVLTDLPYNQPRYIAFRAIDRRGNKSALSTAVTVSVKPLVNTDIIGKVIDGANIVNNTIVASDAIVANSITGSQIAALAISAGKIQANAITADKIAVGAVDAEAISATAIDGKVITGATIQTAASGQRMLFNSTGIYQTDAGGITLSSWTRTAGITMRTATTGARMQIDTNGIRFWNAAGQQTIGLTAGTGDGFLSGVFRTAGPGIFPRVELNNALWGNSFMGIRFFANNGYQEQADLKVQADGAGQIYGGGTMVLTSARPSGFGGSAGGSKQAELRLNVNGLWRLGTNFGDNNNAEIYSPDARSIQATGHDIRLQSRERFHLRGGLGVYIYGDNYGDGSDQLSIVGSRVYSRGIFTNETSASPNVFIQSDMSMWKSVSLREFKLDREEIGVHYELLDLPTMTWRDKSEVLKNELTERRYAGIVAEDLAILSAYSGGSLHPLLVYSDAGDLQSVNYDRVPAYLIPIVRDMHERIIALEAKLTAQEAPSE